VFDVNLDRNEKKLGLFVISFHTQRSGLEQITGSDLL